MMVLYVVPTNLVSVHSDAVPADTLKRSYFTNFICGPETEYRCPGQSMPIPRDKSYHVNPEDELVPGEVEMPQQVTAFDE
jgi:hypothetical protein